MCNQFENKTSFRDLVDAFLNFQGPIKKPGPEAAPNLQPLDAVRPTDRAPVIRASTPSALRNCRRAARTALKTS